MPNGETHKVVGTAAGIGYSAFRARGERLGRFISRIIGGAIGGQIGGATPDVLEPASWPGHRQVAHSIAAGTIVVIGPQKYMTDWENTMNKYSSNLRKERLDESNSPLQRFLSLVGEVACDITAGIPSGFSAGYASHLILDGNQSEIPLVGDPELTRFTRRLHNEKLLNE
jgi:hypothetical protein